MGMNYTQKILTSTNVATSDVENTVQTQDIKVMVNKQLGKEFLILVFHEKKPNSNLVTMIMGNKADILMWRNVDGESMDH
jgi:hypothetical protein